VEISLAGACPAVIRSVEKKVLHRISVQLISFNDTGIFSVLVVLPSPESPRAPA